MQEPGHGTTVRGRISYIQSSEKVLIMYINTYNLNIEGTGVGPDSRQVY